MELEMLISTMNQSNYDLLKRMNIKNKAIIINQITNTKLNPPQQLENSLLKFINVYDKGLSKSRNHALSHADSDIVVLCDDDLYYYDNFANTVLTAYENNKEADIIIFCYDTVGRHNKRFSKIAKRIGYLGTMKVSSVQITFKLKSIRERGIRFNELFGTGSSNYQSGEENIFLFECLKKGLKVYFEPISILFIDDSDESTWFKGYNDKVLFDKGAVFTAMSSIWCHLLIWQFAIRKYKLYREKLSFSKAIKCMYQGQKHYMKNIKPIRKNYLEL